MIQSGRCFSCLRPGAACYCASIPIIDNQTAVLILQHRRERFHPFNTARIVQKALRNCQLLVDHTCNLAAQLRLRPGAGLLYPGPTARPISELTSEQLPEQLVVLDGTWHHAKTLLREIPVLQSLPRYQLAPTAPSRYRIRREPSATALSTVEATVAALRILEPETDGFDRLLSAFDKMVEDQLAHPGSANGQRSRSRPNRTFKNIPLALLRYLENIVVAYGDPPMGQRGYKRKELAPISWVAQRLGTGETFSCLVTPPGTISDVFLKHLMLTREDFGAALSLEEARQRWQHFRQPSDVVAVLNPGTAKLLSYLGGDQASCLVLKSVHVEARPVHSTLPGSFQWASDSIDMVRPLGRAGQRLAQAVDYVRHLNALANTRISAKELVSSHGLSR